MSQDTETNDSPPSVLAALRALVPERDLRFHEALRIAELQAATLRKLTGTTDGAASEAIVADLPRIAVVYRKLPTSGMSYWNGRAWIIALNGGEPLTRQRFTLLHEFKHVMDHGRTHQLYGTGQAAEARAEQACDYFAGCVLMPKQLMKRAWGQGIQQPAKLAEQFDVSPRAAEVRLAQLGLAEPVDRCAASRRARLGPHRGSSYYRQLSSNWPLARPTEVAA